MTDCNEDLLKQARANVASRQMPANGRAVMRGEWDPVFSASGACIAGKIVQQEIERLLRHPILAGEESE